MNTKKFFEKIIECREKEGIPETQEVKDLIKSTVEQLINEDTDEKKPAMLLGKVQGGKTRAYIGVMSYAFDNGYDWVIVFTKGTKALTEQTLIRLQKEFSSFIDDDKLQIHDILTIPDNLTRSELDQKFIIVCKKQKNNLIRLIDIFSKHEGFLRKRLLIIDDEADYASVTFYKNKESGTIDQGIISKQIDQIRNQVQKLSFLQVTATPYSLYLQPDDYNQDDSLFLPKRPKFDTILPTFKGYVGGERYFTAEVDEQPVQSLAYYLYEQVPSEEIEILRAKKRTKRGDRRVFKIEDVLISDKLNMLRKSIFNFIVGACIRRLQQGRQNEKAAKYCFVIHTDTRKISHTWQEEIVQNLISKLEKIYKEELFEKLIAASYNDIVKSIKYQFKDLIYVPDYEELLQEARNVISEGQLLIQKINSETDILNRLDENGQLKLRTPLNIFIGGQVLDRGLTIKNLIGFYYGRNPKRIQQDTVLQHSRMYGARSDEDLAVTRIYTTMEIYNHLERINEFDNSLRDALEKGAMGKGVHFIKKDSENKIIPCSPNKLAFSNLTVLKPYKRLLPIGFDTDYQKNIKPIIREIDKIISGFEDGNEFFELEIDYANLILDKIYSTLKFDAGYSWDLKSIKASLDFISKSAITENEKGKIWCLVRKNRGMSKKKEDGSYSNSPDNPETDLPKAKERAIDTPVLMLFQQTGSEKSDWRAVPFWWPVILCPQKTQLTIYEGN